MVGLFLVNAEGNPAYLLRTSYLGLNIKETSRGKFPVSVLRECETPLWNPRV